MSVLCKTEEIIVDTNEYNSDEADENIRLTLEDSGGESYQQNYQPEQHHSSPRQRNVISVTRHLIAPSGKSSSKSIMESEKRMRREIANSNERRRMQSINAGFQSLRSLLPHHEGEKLSKAAILQQTAQYILDLEREKTHLLSQNSQLKRLLGQHEMGGGCGSGGGGNENGGGAIKKRKLTDTVMTIQTISDSSDEGLGSMSPEPVTLISSGNKTTTSTYIGTSTKEVNELKGRLEVERKRRTVLEERLRQLERQIYPNQYIQREVIEHTDNLREEEVSVSIINDPLKLQVVEIDSLPTVGQTQVVVCSSIEEMQEEEVCTISEDIIHENVHEEVIIPEETTEYVEVPSRLQPILEAAIKAEPKVEVERINATLTKIKTEPKTEKDGKQGNSRMYLTSTSRQNLETIVEAIRHLEGDHLFGDMAEQKKAQKHKPIAQEAPLALTNKSQHRKLPAELSPFLQLKKQNSNSGGDGNTVTIVGTTTSRVATAIIPPASSSSCNSSNNSSSNNNVKCISSNSTSSSSNISNGCVSNNSIVKTVTLASSSAAAIPKSSPASATATPTSAATTQQVTIAAAPSSVKQQCRPGVIVAKKIS